MSAPALLLQAWEAAHPAESPRLHALGQAAALALLALCAALVARALARGRRYRAVKVLDRDAREGLRGAIAAAERRSAGEISVIVLERSDPHQAAAWMAGAASLAAGTALLFGVLPWGRPPLLLCAQAGLFLLGFLLARLLPDFGRLFVSERRASSVAHEQAVQEFFAHDVHHTEGKTGVLLFVSLFERRALVLGDEGIDAKVDAEHWEATCDAVLAGARRGDLRGGLLAGVGLCAAVLEKHFPRPESDRDEVHDHVVVRRE